MGNLPRSQNKKDFSKSEANTDKLFSSSGYFGAKLYKHSFQISDMLFKVERSSSVIKF